MAEDTSTLRAGSTRPVQGRSVGGRGARTTGGSDLLQDVLDEIGRQRPELSNDYPESADDYRDRCDNRR